MKDNYNKKVEELPQPTHNFKNKELELTSGIIQ